MFTKVPSPTTMQVYMVLDAARAAHIPGVGTFGSGFLSDPSKAWIDRQMESFRPIDCFFSIVTGTTLVVTSALLVVTRSYY